MRHTLITLSILNILAAVLIIAAGYGVHTTTRNYWGKRRGELVEAGALTEQPQLIRDVKNRDWWLMRELLPGFEKWPQYWNTFALGLGAQGVVLLSLARRKNADGD